VNLTPYDIVKKLDQQKTQLLLEKERKMAKMLEWMERQREKEK
jgi:hypothetical protein